MARVALSLFLSLFIAFILSSSSSSVHFDHEDPKMFILRRSLISISPSPETESAPPASPLVCSCFLNYFSCFSFDFLLLMHVMLMQVPSTSRVYGVTAYGADPTGKTDSTDALLKAISDVFQTVSGRNLMQGINDLGGAQIHLQGGSYLISRPLQLPASGGGNLVVCSFYGFFDFSVLIFYDKCGLAKFWRRFMEGRYMHLTSFQPTDI